MSIEVLPPELLRHILLFLPDEDLRSAMLVSSRFFDPTRNVSFWDEVLLDRVGGHSECDVLHRIACLVLQTQSISEEVVVDGEIFPSSRELLRFVVETGVGLTQPVLSNCTCSPELKCALSWKVSFSGINCDVARFMCELILRDDEYAGSLAGGGVYTPCDWVDRGFRIRPYAQNLSRMPFLRKSDSDGSQNLVDYLSARFQTGGAEHFQLARYLSVDFDEDAALQNMKRWTNASRGWTFQPLVLCIDLSSPDSVEAYEPFLRREEESRIYVDRVKRFVDLVAVVGWKRELKTQIEVDECVEMLQNEDYSFMGRGVDDNMDFVREDIAALSGETVEFPEVDETVRARSIALARRFNVPYFGLDGLNADHNEMMRHVIPGCILWSCMRRYRRKLDQFGTPPITAKKWCNLM